MLCRDLRSFAYVDIATVLVADTLVTLLAIAALGALTSEETVLLAGMGRVGRGDGVGLPDIHLRAACAILATAGVLVLGRRLPAHRVGLSVDPLDVVGTLSIAITWLLVSKSLLSIKK